MENSSRRITRFLVGTLLLTMLTGWFTLLQGCRDAKSKNATADSTTSEPVGPAPDNSAATNPSLADTAFKADTAAPKNSRTRKHG